MFKKLKRILRMPIWALSFFCILGSAFYWVILASDRYVSQATVVLDSPDIGAPSLSFSSLLTGGADTKDLLFLREHLLSVDMAIKLDNALDIRSHYSNPSIDVFSRLNASAYLEKFHRYYQKRVHVEVDEYSGVLRLSVQGYDAKFTKRIASFLLESGEAHMNAMGQKLAEEQVEFMEGQVKVLVDKVAFARRELINYQNQHGQISPTSTVEALSMVVASLESELSRLKANKQISLGYLSEDSSEVKKLDAEIIALQNQITAQQERMATANGDALNEVSAGYMALDRQLKFNIDMYGNALAALESTRVQAARTLKQVSILQAPTSPEYAMQPKRLYNLLSTIIVVLVLASICQMTLILVREHRD